MAKIELNVASNDRAVQALNKQLGKTDDELAAITKSGRGATAMAERFAKQADPTRRYEGQLAKVAVAVKKGGLELGHARTLAEKYTHQLDRATGAGKRAFGSGALSEIKSFVMGLGGVGAALASIVQAFREVAEARKTAAEAARSAQPGFGALSQLAATSGGTFEERQRAFAAMETEALAMHRRGVGGTPEESATFLFRLLSATVPEQDRKFAAELAARNVFGGAAGVASVAEAHSALTANLGRAEVGSFKDVVATGLAVSEIAPAQASEILVGAGRAGSFLKALGFGEEFGAAGAAVLARSTGDPRRGETQLVGALRGLERVGIEGDPTLRGLSGVELLNELGRRDLNRAGLAEIVGTDTEGILGIRALIENRETVARLTANARAAQLSGLGAQASELAISTQFTGSAYAGRVAENNRQIAQTLGLGGRENLFQAVEADRAAARVDRFGDTGSLINAIVDLKNAFMNFGPRGPSALEDLTLQHRANDPNVSQQTRDAISNHMGEQTKLLRDIRDQSHAGRQE